MARKFTVTQLTTAVRRRADLENDTHVADAEIYEWLSTYYAELYDILVSSGLHYFETSYSFASNGGSSYALPADFYAMLRLDYVLSAETNVELKEIGLRELHHVSGTSARAAFYRVVGENLILYPQPPSGHNYVLKYIPAPIKLEAGATEVDGISGWEDYLVTGAVLTAHSKRENDAAVAIAKDRLKDLRARITQNAQNRAIASATSLVESAPSFDYEIDAADWRQY